MQLAIGNSINFDHLIILGSSDTASSEISSDESDSTVDSEAGPTIFDENICPSGCDTALYEMAFSMREKRYAHEFEIRGEQREIESLCKEVELDTKKLRVVENNLKSDQENLEAFMVIYTSHKVP